MKEPIQSDIRTRGPDGGEPDRLYRLRDELAFYLARHRPDELDSATITGFFQDYQRIWDQLGEHWLEYRRTALPG